MRHRSWILVAAILSIFVAYASAQQQPEKGGANITGPYEVVPNWPKAVHKDYTWGRTASVWAESPNRVYVLQTGELPILDKPMGGKGAGTEYIPNRSAVRTGAFRGEIIERMEHHVMVFDAEGTLVGSLDPQFNNVFTYQHRMATNPWDPEKPIWITENATNEVFKFSNDGKKLLLKVGEHNKAGNDETHFNGPNDIAFMPNGDFLVADGSGNHRVVRYSKEGKYVSQFGKDAGCGQRREGGTVEQVVCPKDLPPGTFGNLHGIAVDAKQRIYVADRHAGRIQVFDQYGKVLDVWPGIPNPSSIAVSKDQRYVWVTDETHNKILQFDMEGRLLSD
jgi:DNA-binding beta-propeller fold protein YncE